LQLQQLDIVSKEELPQAKDVLDAAAMTYIAGTLSSLLQLIRLILLFNRDRD
jgi:Zn-dependent membrane protease YugP